MRKDTVRKGSTERDDFESKVTRLANATTKPS
jgi:hypothetical protein